MFRLIKGSCCSNFNPRKVAKGIYALGVMIGTTIAILLKAKGGEWIYSNLDQTPDVSLLCWEMLSVYRTSLSLILYHSFLALILIKLGEPEDDFRWAIHFQIWPIKALLWIGTFIGMFWIANDSMIKFWIPSCIVLL
jgi:hypothetical protein